MYRLAPLLVLALVIACGGAESTTAPDPPRPPESDPPAPLDVPLLSEAWTIEAPSAPEVVVTRDAISVGGARIVTLVDGSVRPEDRRGGEQGIAIAALHERLAGASPPPGPTALGVHPDTSFRTFASVIYTLAQAERARIALVVRRGAETAALPIETVGPERTVQAPVENLLLGAVEDGALADILRDGVAADPFEERGAQADQAANDPSEERRVQAERVAGAPGRAPSQPDAARVEDPHSGGSTLNLSVIIIDAGFSVGGSGGYLLPGCEQITAAGDAVAVPLRGGAYDFAGLRRCMERVAREFPDDHDVMISADPQIPFRVFAETIAATRGTPDRPLFPRTLLVMGVR